MDITFERTSLACPEQYDIYSEGEQVGYMRLRHGFLYVSDASQSEYYFERSFPLADSSAAEPEELRLLNMFDVVYADGIFEDQAVRQAYMDIAKRKIEAAHQG